MGKTRVNPGQIAYEMRLVPTAKLTSFLCLSQESSHRASAR